MSNKILSEFEKVCYMLRINPAEVDQNFMKIGTIGLPNLMNFEDKKYLKNGIGVGNNFR